MRETNGIKKWSIWEAEVKMKVIASRPTNKTAKHVLPEDENERSTIETQISKYP